MKIKPTKDAKDLWEIDERIASEALIFTKGDDIPLPWDAIIEVEGDKVIMEGSILGGSASTYKDAGYCRCEISIEKFPVHYDLEVDVSTDDEETIQKLHDAGWVRV